MLQRICALVFLIASCAGCGNTSNSNLSGSEQPNIPQGPNVLAVTIGGAGLCGGIWNQPCVSVTLCLPGTVQCQTVNDILLDTGSVGLRIFRSVLTIDFSTQIETDAQGNLIGECLIFGTGADWGPVAMAGVVLAQEPDVVVPIHLIDATFAGQSGGSNPCGQPVDTKPTTAHHNGILGIDGFVSDQRAGLYFSCGVRGCTPIAQPPGFVQNPVAALPADNNGYVVMFPAVGNSGAASLTGAVILGIGTQSNNAPTGVSVYMRDPATGTIATTYNGTTSPGFLDTGSTFLFFRDPTIPLCHTISGAFCPSSPLNLSAVNQGSNQLSGNVNFQVANAGNFLNTGNVAFNNIGGPDTGLSGEFDWGLPFFLGRTVYVGIDTRISTLGAGSYWAY
ncbi:MAG: DUF3443 family protein [Nitrospira sp.]